MYKTDNINPRSILIVDPQTEGHHLTWIRYVTRTFLNQNFQVTLMADLRAQSAPLVKNAIANEIKEIRLISTFDEKVCCRGGNYLKKIARTQHQKPSANIFMNELDLVASNCLRKAAIGLYPPQRIKGILSGVYFRPRFLFENRFSIANLIKSYGFQKLYRDQWFKHIFLMDEQRTASVVNQFPNLKFHLLPDPWDGNFSIRQKHAQSVLELPQNRFIILQFGIGTRRKGIHLVIEAMKNLPESSPIFLLCAGKLSINSKLRRQLELLEKRNKAKVLDRYVSHQEEELCFCATDTVLLPYVQHLGSSGVLSRAAAAGKPVIASDFDLTGWRVCHHELGLLFQDSNINAFCSAINTMASMNEHQLNKFHLNALKFGQTCNLKEFETALVSPFESEGT